MSQRTRVRNVRGRKRAELEADPEFLYVGRAVTRAGWSGSHWSNPFRVGRGSSEAKGADPQLCRDPEEAVSRFRDWVTTGEGRHLLADLPSLRGKVLGCWCCDWDGVGPPPAPCHAVILARLADAEAI